MKKTVLLIIVIIIGIIIIGWTYIISNNNSDKLIRLADEEKIAINDQLSLLTGINSGGDTLRLSKNEGNIIESDKSKYEFMGFLHLNGIENGVIFINNGGFNEMYIEISKFQNYAKKVYNQELNMNNLKNYISIQNNITYIKVPTEGIAADYIIKADYITENRKNGTRSLYVDLIDVNNIGEEFDKYNSKNFLNYDKSKVTYSLKITYAFSDQTQENYIISIESV